MDHIVLPIPTYSSAAAAVSRVITANGMEHTHTDNNPFTRYLPNLTNQNSFTSYFDKNNMTISMMFYNSFTNKFLRKLSHDIRTKLLIYYELINELFTLFSY